MKDNEIKALELLKEIKALDEIIKSRTLAKEIYIDMEMHHNIKRVSISIDLLKQITDFLIEEKRKELQKLK